MQDVMFLFSVVIATVIGSILWWKKIRGLEKLKKAGATSPRNAVKPEEAGMSRLEEICMKASEELKSTKDSRYYIERKHHDEDLNEI